MVPRDAQPGTPLYVRWVPADIEELVTKTVVLPMWVTVRRAYARPDAAPFPFRLGEFAILSAVEDTKLLACGYGVRVYGRTGLFAPHHFGLKERPEALAVGLPGLPGPPAA